MWCRAILTITLLACTFQRTNGQSHDTKDLLCVLILSGLHKEDLDVALLRKLQHHNVNIDDLDNSDIHNKCKLGNSNNSDNEPKHDTKQPMRKQFQRNQTTNDKVQTIQANSTKEDENIKRILNLISSKTPEVKLISSITPKVNLHSTIEDTTTAKVVTLVKAHSKSEPNSITYINKVLQEFFAQVATVPTTSSPATTDDLKNILYEIKYMLANRTVNGRKVSTESKNGPKEYNFDDDSQKINNDKNMNKIKDMRRQKEIAEFLNRSQEVYDDRPIKDDTQLLSQKQPLTEKKAIQESSQIDIKTIPVNILKSIAESVKAMVLQDLKKEMSINTSTSTASSTDTTTTKTSIKQENDLAQLIQLFQQLKNNMIPVVNDNFTGQTHHEIKSDIKITPSLTSVQNNRYNNPVLTHIVHNIQVPNAELQSLPLFKQHSINRIDQVNIYNPKHEIHPITIQTNIGQIPPLQIPMMAPPLKMIYQNIIVTTENPFQYYKSLHKLKSTPKINAQFLYSNDFKKLSSKPQHAIIKMEDSPKDYNLKPIDHTKYLERMRTPSYYSPKDTPKQEHAYGRSRNRNFERFHEKLERVDPDDWQQYPNEHINVEKMGVAPRHQKSLNDKPKFDDTHFKNFLKTQQKVNDMLERILATKIIEGPKSVEIL